ncbi:helix-turn-helix domain-containing protein [Pseudomonas proteolytica]|uniref:helix-turn-helix domain-containing protein n=2 Tax=Pseudomonas TaxID=286 RepID=UPI001F1C992E|nr:helix-turn-helix transcriptional regulator [Pseudomonas proteolytica]
MIMTLKNEIGAALRAIRQQRGLSYEELNESTFRTSLSLIERGKSKLTIEKLSSLAKALDFDLLAFMAMCIALERGQTPDDAIAAAQSELDRFKAAGGLALLQEQIVDGELVSRSKGKPANSENKNAVRRLKAEGKTQAEIRQLLGLSKSTVSQYWHSES